MLVLENYINSRIYVRYMQKDEILEKIRFFLDYASKYYRFKNHYVSYIVDMIESLSSRIKKSREYNHEKLSEWLADPNVWNNFPEYAIFKKNIHFFLNDKDLTEDEKQFVWILHSKKFEGDHNLVKFINILHREKKFLASTLKFLNDLSSVDKKLSSVVKLCRKEVNQLIRRNNVEIKLLQRGKLKLLRRVILDTELDKRIKLELDSFLEVKHIPVPKESKSRMFPAIVSVLATLSIVTTACFYPNKNKPVDHSLDREIYQKVIDNINKNKSAEERVQKAEYLKHVDFKSMDLQQILLEMDKLSDFYIKSNLEARANILKAWHKGYDVLVEHLRKLEEALSQSETNEVATMTKNELVQFIDDIQELLHKTQDQSMRQKLLDLWEKAYGVLNSNEQKNEKSVKPVESKEPEKSSKVEEETSEKETDDFNMDYNIVQTIAERGPEFVSFEIERITNLLHTYDSNPSVEHYLSFLRQCDDFFNFRMTKLDEWGINQELSDFKRLIDKYIEDHFRISLDLVKRAEMDPSLAGRISYYQKYDLDYLSSLLISNLDSFDYFEDRIKNDPEVLKKLVEEHPQLKKKLVTKKDTKYYLDLIKSMAKNSKREYFYSIYDVGDKVLADIDPDLLNDELVLECIKLHPSEMAVPAVFDYIDKHKLTKKVIDIDMRFYFLALEPNKENLVNLIAMAEKDFKLGMDLFLSDVLFFLSHNEGLRFLQDKNIFNIFIKYKAYDILKYHSEKLEINSVIEVVKKDKTLIKHIFNRDVALHILKEIPEAVNDLNFKLKPDISLICDAYSYNRDIAKHIRINYVEKLKKIISIAGPDFLEEFNPEYYFGGVNIAPPEVKNFIKENYPQFSKQTQNNSSN